MRKLWFLALAVWVVALPARVDAQDGQFFLDTFDTYATGSTIGGQGGWEPWDLNPLADTIVTNAQSFNPPNSLLISGTADVVHQFTGVTSGIWYARAFVFIPSTHDGESWFILLNQYTPGGPNNWSAQVVFCRVNCTTAGAIPGMVASLGGSDVGGTGTIPLILDQWVEIRAQVNLTANTYQLFYGGVQFENSTWTITGSQALAAMDLFSNGANQSFMDHAWVDQTAPVEAMSFSVN
jgi:hypothetical protein